MWRYTCVALLLAWPIAAQDWSEIEPPLRKIEQGLSLIDSSTSGISDYFRSERLRLTSDLADLQAEKLSLTQESVRLQTESDNLKLRELGLTSRELALEKRGRSLDEREKRIERAEVMLKYAPWVAGGVFVIGVIVGAVCGR